MRVTRLAAVLIAIAMTLTYHAVAGGLASAGTSTPVCTIEGDGQDDVLYGTDNPDVICGYGGSDRIYGFGSGDRLYGGPGRDYLVGGKGDDRLIGGNGNDRAWGEPGADLLLGKAGSDALSGDQGPDRIFGGIGRDPCLHATDGTNADVVDGGDGRDVYDSNGGDTVRRVEVEQDPCFMPFKPDPPCTIEGSCSARVGSGGRAE